MQSTMPLAAIAAMLAEGDAAANPYLFAAGGFVAGAVLAALAVKALSKPAAPVEPPKPPEPLKPSGAPLRLLALLQRESRLLDFLLEDVQPYGDAQIGAAVRDIHRNARKAIQEHLVLEPILPGEEGTNTTVPAGFDPSAVRLTGNVTGQPPFAGTLRHHGWRVKEIKLATSAPGQDEFVVQPAEVEL
ncbi:MAG: DUF2760 domain-containing protein [Gemmataceae bacterium]